VDVAPKTDSDTRSLLDLLRRLVASVQCVDGGGARPLPQIETLSAGALGRLLHHQDPRVKKLAEDERSRRANLRRGLARFDRITAAWALRHSPALAECKAVLAALPLNDAVKARISRLLRRAPVRRFRESPEAPEAAKLVREILRAAPAFHDLLELLPRAEESQRLPPGTANALAEARTTADGFFGAVARFSWELELERLDPEIRGYMGRPSAARWTKLEDAIAAEIRLESPRRVWPMVADLLRPLIEASGDKIHTDAVHIRHRVVRLHRRQRRKGIDEDQATIALAEFLESTEMSDELWAKMRATPQDVARRRVNEG